jgi:deoxyribose-phosphate aldolase
VSVPAHQPPHTVATVAERLDLAVLRPTLTDDDLAAQAELCIKRGVGCLCVRPTDVAAAARLLEGSSVVIASVVGFPHGSHRTAIKAAEARQALAEGARELDMVMDIPAFLSGRDDHVRQDIEAVVTEARRSSALVKVILETCYLSRDAVVRACLIAAAAEADFVKTSTGFGTGGATTEAVAAMLATVGDRLGVKASGGIRTWADACRYLDMGCSRLGVGDAAAILDGGR